MESSEVAKLIAAFSYPAVFLLTLGAGIGFPISEELVFFLGGVSIAKGGGNFWLMCVCAILGTLGGDLFLFRLGRTLGPATTGRKRLAKILTPERVARVQGYFHRFGSFTVFGAGFLAGLRLPTFVMAGASGMSLRRFLIADILCLVLFAPAIIYVGYRFGTDAWDRLFELGRYLPLIVGAIAIVVAGYYWIRRRALDGTNRK